MSACSEPGCTGVIEDGYCNTCGMAEGSTPPAATGGTAGPSDPSTQPPRSVRTVGVGRTAAGSAGGVAEAPSVSSRLASTPIGSARTTGGSKRTRRLRGRGPARSRLGAGLTTVPVAPLIDPMLALMSPAVVAENKRYCSNCGAAVGRGRDAEPGRTKGFCPQCRTPYDFEPKLGAGVLLGGQYEVMGCLAHGGMGWIYLARDRNVNDRWVVLKGLLNAGDPDAYQAAVGEKGFLAEVEHPLIVEIYNFETDADGSSYIVMEYVGGKSLNTILKDRAASSGGRFDPLPVDQAISFMLEVLPAFSYLHAAGLLFCDFKPANLIQVGDTMKLIDLGGVRRIGDDTSPIYGTIGFQAPEVPAEGTTIASDIYTIARTLAVLVFEFKGFQTEYEHSLPDQASVPVFAAHDSLYRLLLKGTATEPADRFQSADELREQLLGVLREVAVDPAVGALGSTPSSLFESPVVATDQIEWSELPRLRPDPDDPMTPWIAGVTVTEPTERLTALAEAPQSTAMVHIANAYAALARGGSTDRAIGETDAILAEDPWDWRAVWLTGLVALATGDHAGAISAFNTVYGQIPGELAPKLALAVACERAGDVDVARSLYATCAGADAAYTAPAQFGLARLAEADGDLDGALDALGAIAPTSRAWTAAKGHRARLLATLATRTGDLATLDAAAQEFALSGNDPYDLAIGRVWVLETALGAVESSGDRSGAQVAGVPATEVDLRRALESTWRAAAQHSEDAADRVRCVDRANAVRPRTLM